MPKLKYDEDFPSRAEDFARRGMTDREIARKLGISHETFYQYIKIYPDFSDSVKRGKAPIDFEVENKLLKRALGFEYEEVTIVYKPGKENEKDKKAKPILIRKTMKRVIPDVKACMIWLRNRRPDLWKYRQNVALSENFNIKIVSVAARSKKRKGNGNN